MRRTIPSEQIYLSFICFIFILDTYTGGQHTNTKNDHPPPQNMEVKPEEKSSTEGKISSWQLYMKVFEQNRAIQRDAVKNMQNYGKYEERYKLTEIIVKQLFKVLNEAKVNITEWGYIPGDPFPSNQTIREGLSQILENTAMFGDLFLRLPDIVHRIYDKQGEWRELIAWAVWFSQQTEVVDLSSSMGKLLHLMSQELNLVERDPDYTNPFTEENILLKEVEALDEETDVRVEKKSKKKKKKDKRRGPRLSGARVEL